MPTATASDTKPPKLIRECPAFEINMKGLAAYTPGRVRDLATLFLESIILPTINGKSAMQNDHVLAELKKGDLYDMAKPIHQQATNVYQTKDGKWYHLHGSMNASATMGMVGVEEQDVTREEAIKIFSDKVAQYDAAYLEKTANEHLRQAGVTCLTPEEFFASEHGKIMADEPLWTMKPVPAPRSTWPAQKSNELKPLEGIRVIDFSRVIAAPVISKVLAVLGAEVIKVSNKNLPDVTATWIDLSTGKKDANIDLKSDEGKNTFKRLVAGADVLIDGYRPGVLAKLGFNSASLRTINPKLVYVRESCYGFKGPLAYRSGWQQISDCLVGISWLQGKFLGLNEPVVPLLRTSMSPQCPFLANGASANLVVFRSQFRLSDRSCGRSRSLAGVVSTDQSRLHLRH